MSDVTRKFYDMNPVERLQQMADQACVAEVDLGRLDQPLAEVLGEGLGQKQKAGDFQDPGSSSNR